MKPEATGQSFPRLCLRINKHKLSSRPLVGAAAEGRCKEALLGRMHMVEEEAIL